ncbi:MAG: phosphoribosylglycinamide formyltransferase [Candidatus Eisenbacteria bacterium]
MRRAPIGVLASGRGSNLVAILEAAKDPDYPASVALVLSDVEDAPALDHARRAGVDAVYVPPGARRARISPESEDRMVEELRKRDVRLVALAGFMRILSPRLLNAFPNRVVNIHPSLLPSFPGLEAQRQAHAYGVRVSGCTTHLVDAGIDTGPILFQTAVPVLEDDTAESVAARILEEEHELYPRTIAALLTHDLVVSGRRCLFRQKGDPR